MYSYLKHYKFAELNKLVFSF